MGKYSSYVRQRPKPPRGVVHPVMRGIGCILVVVVPILAYGAATLLVQYGIDHRWPMPPGWLRPYALPPLLLNVQALAWLQGFLRSEPRLIAHLVFTIVISVVILGLMSVLFGFMYTLFGPPRYGPTDAPPPRTKAKPYKR